MIQAVGGCNSIVHQNRQSLTSGFHIFSLFGDLWLTTTGVDIQAQLWLVFLLTVNVCPWKDKTVSDQSASL